MFGYVGKIGVFGLSKIHGDICKSRCTTSINNTGANLLVLLMLVANFPPLSTTLAATLPPMSMTPVVNNGNNIRLLRP